MVSRRAYLGGSISTVTGMVAGCLDAVTISCGCAPPSSLELTPVDSDVALARAAANSLDERHRAVYVPLFRQATDGNATVYDTWRPVGTTRPVLLEDTVYDVRRSITGRNVSNAYAIHSLDERERGTEATASTVDSATGAAIDFSELPPQDRAAFGDLEYRVSLFSPTTAYRKSRTYAYEDDRSESVFVPEQQYDAVRLDGDRIPVRFEPMDDNEVHEYTYSAENGRSVAAYGQQLRQEYAFSISNLSEEESSVLEDAAGRSSYPREEPFYSILGRLFEHEPVFVVSNQAEWPVRWDGQRYWTSVELYRDGKDKFEARLEAYRSD